MIYCGDAQECLEQLGPATVHTCIAHPPYWQAHENGELGGEHTFTDYLSSLLSVLNDVHHALLPAGDLWLIIDTLDIVLLLKESGWFHAHTCTWESDYILHFNVASQPVQPLDVRWTFPEHEDSVIACLQYYRPLPSALVSTCILLSTDVGDTVLDLFSGTGVTSVEAQKLARHTIAVDKDPIACAMLEARLRR